MKSKFRPKPIYEHDALAFNQSIPSHEKERINHFSKAKARKRGEEVVFDPKGHKDYLTGFRKRKLQRKKDAQEHLEIKAKKERAQERSERLKELKKKLNLPDDYGVSSSSDDEGERGAPADPSEDKRAQVRVYSGSGVTTTVSVLNLRGDSDDEPASSSGGGGSGEDGEGEEGGGEDQQGGGESNGQQEREDRERQRLQERGKFGKRGKNMRRSKASGGGSGKRRPGGGGVSKAEGKKGKGKGRKKLGGKSRK